MANLMKQTSAQHAKKQQALHNQSDSFDVPAALLESFIPGFGLLSGLFEALTGFDATNIVSYAVIVALALGAVAYVSRGVRRIFFAWLTSSITITSTDRLFEQVLYWHSQHELSRGSRSLRGKTSARSDLVKTHNSSSQSDAAYNFAQIESSVAPEYIPAYGNHVFWFKGWPLFLALEQIQQSGVLQVDYRGDRDQPQTIKITCLGRSTEPVKKFLMECKRFDAESKRSKTIIRRSAPNSNGAWQRSLERQSRPLDTVYMDEEKKKEICSDIREFIDPQAQRYYARRGIPYRRGYLFHGAPGTGKTSLSFALAGEFGFDLYVISLREPGMNEHKLTELFARLPAHCIVLLEDLDTAGLEKRAAMVANSAEGEAARPGSNRPSEGFPKTNDPLTLSGLLNAIDGVASHEGRILIATSNDPEALDTALVRPGRIDLKIHFSLAKRREVYTIFQKMYSETEDDRRIDGMAERFSDIVPELTFSPAEIQGFLLKYKRGPERALDEAPSWRDQLIAAHKSGSNISETKDQSQSGR